MSLLIHKPCLLAILQRFDLLLTRYKRDISRLLSASCFIATLHHPFCKQVNKPCVRLGRFAHQK